MKMPRDIDLTISPDTPGLIQFRTRCGHASGTAFHAPGEHETHYDIVDMRKLAAPPGEGPPHTCSIVGREIGTFDVVGQVGLIFEDGMFPVESCGFDFWVAPDEAQVSVQPDDWVFLSICKFTLYV
jgi:hypothetical protein